MRSDLGFDDARIRPNGRAGVEVRGSFEAQARERNGVEAGVRHQLGHELQGLVVVRRDRHAGLPGPPGFTAMRKNGQVLNALTTLQPAGSCAAVQEPLPAPDSRASTAASPSRCGKALLASMTTLPSSAALHAALRPAVALNGMASRITSPNAAASSGVPTRPFGSGAVRELGLRELTSTSCPAWAQRDERGPPTMPTPMTPILMAEAMDWTAAILLYSTADNCGGLRAHKVWFFK